MITTKPGRYAPWPISREKPMEQVKPQTAPQVKESVLETINNRLTEISASQTITLCRVESLRDRLIGQPPLEDSNSPVVGIAPKRSGVIGSIENVLNDMEHSAARIHAVLNELDTIG